MTIIASNSLTLSNVNDGTITHVAYAYSADGTDRFTTVYPNLNLFTGTSDKPSTSTGGSWNIATIGVYKTPKVGQEYTISVEVPEADHDVMMEVFRWNNAGERVGWPLSTKRIKSGEKAQITFTWPDPTDSGATQIEADLAWTNDTDTGTYSYCKAKLEISSTATPYMPSASEVTTADYPRYIGQYTDFTQADSTKPSDYTWSLIRGNDGKDGATGKDGIAGKDGVGIKTTVITYAISTSGTTAPNSAWTSSVPSLVKGQYLWTKTVWTYTDNSSETGYSVTYISKDGNNGNDGIAGKDGTGIKTTTITYAVGTSGTTAPTGGWTSQVPNVPAGQYLWTKTVWDYTDKTSETGYSVSKFGEKGPKGDQGIQGLQGPDGTQGIPGPKGVDGTDAPTITVKSYTWAAGSRAEIELTGPNAFKQTVYYRGHNVWVIDATTHELKEFVSCDTWNSMSFSHNGVSTTLADYLASLIDSIVVIAASDADAVDQNVRDVLNSMGGTPEFGTWGSWRIGHVFIGMSKRNDGTWPLQPRQGYEEAINKDGSAPEIGCTLSKGGIVAKGADGKTQYTHIAYANSVDGVTNFSTSDSNRAYIGMYVDFNINDSTTPSDYSWTLVKGADGTQGTPGKPGADGKTPYFHTAYAYSADGTDRFTTTYPNLNLLKGTKDFSGYWDHWWDWTDDGTYKGLVVKKQTGLWNGIRKEFTAPKDGVYTFSAYIKASGDNVNIRRYVEIFDINGNQKWDEVVNDVFMGNNFDWKRDYFTLNLKKGDKIYPRHEITNSGTLWTAGHKWEEGSTATPYMRSASEVTTADWPSYIGQYTDFTQADSTKPSDYTWSLFKGQDSNAYTAYSWSSDGAERFTTVYPNLNLLVNSSAKTKDGFFKDFDKVENGYGEVTLKGTNSWPTVNLQDGFCIKPREYKPGDTYTMSMDVMFTSWNMPAGTSVAVIWLGQRYTQGGGIDSWKAIYTIELPKDPSKKLNQWIRITKTSTIPPYENDSIGTEAVLQAGIFGPNEGSFTLRIRNPKLEQGSTATPRTPSQSEAQDQWQDAIPMYVGVGEKDSQKPSDYRWVLNPRYVQASSDSGLSNKAGVDDLASVANTANDALVQAQNAVSNEDYTSWLEHDYQTTIDNLHAVSTQNQKDINNVDDRTTIVEGFYDRMKVKWNFINESFTFSEEGMFISNAQSKMAIQVTSDKIVFWDNNVDVAFITGEVLNIQKGVFLESATIGNHLITKFSNDSPVTIIRYVGGIT